MGLLSLENGSHQPGKKAANQAQMLFALMLLILSAEMEIISKLLESKSGNQQMMQLAQI